MPMVTDYIDTLKATYPRRKGGQGWADTERQIEKHLRTGHDFKAILAGCTAYREFCDREGLTGTEYVKQAVTFFGPGRWWQEDYSEPAKPPLPAEIAAARRWQALMDRADRAGFRNPTPLEKSVDPSVYEGQLKIAEQASNIRAIR
jgi:hypothetical protein